MRMDRDEFMPHAPAHAGRVRVNHSSDSCHGGRDSMTVERMTDGSVRAYCFRCGYRGFVGADVYRKTATELRAKYEHVHGTPSRSRVRTKPESGGTKGYRSYPALVRSWINEAGLDNTHWIIEESEWFESHNSLYIPVQQGLSIIGWVMRSFNPKDYRPVPLVSMDNWYAHYLTPEASTVVLTEDVLSCYRCYIDSNHDAIALMGTEIKDSIINTMLKHNYHKAIVFLDGDNTTVRMKARKITKRLPFLDTKIIETGRDPKRHSKGELTCLLT